MALVVGANHGDAGDQALRYAEEDARRMGETLVRLGSVAPPDLVQLLGTDARAFEEAIGRAGARLSREAAPGDRTVLIVYYSGHADSTALKMGGSRLPLKALLDEVEAVDAELRVLIVDACESGDLLRLKGASPAAAFEIIPRGSPVGAGMAVITSSGVGEAAQESERLGGGVFTHHLLAGLAGAADVSGDGRVALDEAYRYAYNRTLATTSRAPVLQHPSYAYNLEGHADIPLTDLKGDSQTGRIRFAQAGQYVIFNVSESQLVAEAEVGAGAALALPSGSWKVLRRESDRAFEGIVTVRPGEETALSVDALRPQPFGQTARRGGPSRPHTAVALSAGGGAAGAMAPGLGVGGWAAVGARFDPPWLTAMVRVRGATDSASNAVLGMKQRMLGVEASALRLDDFGPLSLGLGLEIGVDQIWQRFETTGEAPNVDLTSGHLGPVGRVELALGSRVTLGASLALEVYGLPESEEGKTSLRVVTSPNGGLDVAFWLR